MFSSPQPITYSRLLIIDKRMTVREVKQKIYKFFRSVIKTPPCKYGAQRKHVPEDKIIEEEYQYFFENKDQQSNQYESGNPLYALFINNNLPID